MKIDKNAVIAFDMDGVLIDSKLSIFNALNSALGIFNIPKLDGSQVELIGLPLIEMLKRASEYKLNDDQLNVAMHKFRAYNNENGPKEAKPYEDIPRVLELLAQRFNLVVVTSKLQSAAIDLLHALDLVEHFFGIFGIQGEAADALRAVTIENGLVGGSSIGGFPDATVSRSEVIFRFVEWVHRDVNDSAAGGCWTDHSEIHLTQNGLDQGVCNHRFTWVHGCTRSICFCARFLRLQSHHTQTSRQDQGKFDMFHDF